MKQTMEWLFREQDSERITYRCSVCNTEISVKHGEELPYCKRCECEPDGEQFATGNRMTDNEIINVGDVCTYSYDNNNSSLSIVEVVNEMSDEVLVVRFLQVIVDDSGNGFFDYLCKKDKTMNVSKKYLHKIDLITRQKEQIEALIAGQETLQKYIAEKDAEIESLKRRLHNSQLHQKETHKVLQDERLLRFNEEFIKSEAVKECLDKIEQMDVSESDNYIMVKKRKFDNLVKEMVGDEE